MYSSVVAGPRRSILVALSLLGLLLTPAPSPALGSQDLTGFWVWRVPRGDGTYRETVLNLKQAGEHLTGKVVLGGRNLPITDATVKQGHVHFVVSLRPREEERRIVYDGEVEGGRISLASEVPGRPVWQGTAERTTAAAAAPPPRLPLPALHDVPDNGLVRTPPMGWNSWNKFADKVDDATVRAIADAMVSSGMKDAGYVYVNIDDTWQGSRDAQGRITPNHKFPDMKALADYVHSKGLKIGIYSSPGPRTCAGYEGSYGHEEQDAMTYAAWGFDYLKYDWCSAAQIYKDDEMRAVYQKMGDALRKTARPIVYSLCQYGRAEVWKWGSKVGGNLWRTTDDIEDNWKSMSAIGFSQFALAPFARPGHWNDPDMLEIGNGGMNNDEYRTHMSLWALLAAPLLAGNDLRTMSEETKGILLNREVIAIDQDPDAKPARIVAEEGESVVVVRPLHDGSTAVGLFNRNDQPKQVSVSWAQAGLSGMKGRVRDLWKHEEVDASGDRYSAVVPAHGVVLLKVTGQR